MKEFFTMQFFLFCIYTFAQDKRYDTWLLGYRGTDNFFINKIKFTPNAQSFVINNDRAVRTLFSDNFSTIRVNDSVLLTSRWGRFSVYNERRNNYGHLDTAYHKMLAYDLIEQIGENILLPDPEKENFFHLFLTSEFYTEHSDEKIINSSLKYLPVRISNDTLYVVSKLKHLRKEMPVVTKLASTHHGNNKDYWILSHEWQTNRFIAYLLTSNGVVDSVKTNIGYVYSLPILLPPNIFYSNFFQRTMGKLNLGQMKFSTEGSMVAVALSQERIIEIFKFDKFTGKLSCPISLNLNDKFSFIQNLKDYWVYGLEISPNNRLIYFTLTPLPYLSDFDKLPSYLCQLDLWADDILGSIQIIGEGRSFLGLQLAPDGKIYLGIEGSKYLGTIEAPNYLNPLCNFQEKGLFLGGYIHDATLNNVPSSVLPRGYSKSVFDEPQLEMPNAFTPNRDGINDTFIPLRMENVIQARMKIYNKWGKEIFSTSQIEQGWDASEVPADIYYYYVEYSGKICNDTATKTLKGWVQVIK